MSGARNILPPICQSLMISFLPELGEIVVVTPKEKGDNFLSCILAYHFSFVTFQALSQLCCYSTVLQVLPYKVKSSCFKDCFKTEAILWN